MKLGLVLAGGGGKGSYQMGVIKAMEHIGLTKYIQGVAGTSVGALNGALLLNGDIEKACQVWENISPNKILSIKGRTLIEKLKGTPLEKMHDKLEIYSKRLEDYGVFSRKGMVSLIEESVDLHQLSTCDIPFYATCVEFPSMTQTYFQLNRQKPQLIQSMLLATSAIPVVFPPEEIEGKLYIDGGVKDNVPIAPLYKIGCNPIIVIPLDRSYILNRSLYPDASIYEIVPQNSLGHIVSGTLQFNREVAKRHMQDGYNDAMRILRPAFSMLQHEQSVFKSVQKMAYNEQAFQKIHTKNTLEFQKGISNLQNKIQGGYRK